MGTKQSNPNLPKKEGRNVERKFFGRVNPRKPEIQPMEVTFSHLEKVKPRIKRFE